MTDPEPPLNDTSVESLQLIETLRSLLPMGKEKIDLGAVEGVGRILNRLAINFPKEQDEVIAFQCFALIGFASAKGSEEPLADGRLLILSGFRAGEKRITTELAIRRNEFVAALADELWFAHITPGGQMDKLAQRARARNAGQLTA